MLSGVLKKYAASHGLKIAKGIAYGNLYGFVTTLAIDAGAVRIDFATKFADPVQKTAFLDAVSAVDMKKEYKVQRFVVQDDRLVLFCADGIGSMDRMDKLLQWFTALLVQFGASGVQSCTYCGAGLSAGRWVLMDGTAYFLHESCSQNLAGRIEAGNTRRKEEDTGSYAAGFVGAVGGAVLGAIVWALVLLMGYVAALVGLLIGFLSEKGYDLFKGKQGKGKVAILIVAVVLGVFLGTVGGYIGLFMKEVGTGYPLWDYIAASAAFLMENPSDLLMGLLFAGLGVFALLRKTGKAVADDKLTYLD